MKRTTFSISYYCRDSKKNKQGESPIEVCININQQRLFINLPTKVSPKDFNKKRKPAYIEELLNGYRVKTNEIISYMVRNGLPITASTVREHLRTGGTRSKTMTDLCEEYLQHLQTRLGKTMTVQVYKKYELVRDFVVAMCGDKELCTITNGDVIRMYDALKQKYLPSTSAGYMVKIKSLFYYAVDNGYIKANPANNIKINKGAVRVEFLSGDDIFKIKNLDLSDIDRLDKVRDLLLFQASVGVAYCDLVNFDSSNIEVINDVPTYTSNRQKTGVEYTSVILPMGMAILKKYDGQLPLISNQKYNAYLKDIQRLAGVKTNITTHLLRKTYAHTLLNNGVNISVVAKCLGHTTTQITQRCYCKPSTSFVANEVGNMLKGGFI